MRGIVLISLSFALCLAAVAQTTDREWQAKAVEKYPALGVQGSEFNKRFLEAYTHRQKTDPAFFSNPQWPVSLADEVAADSSLQSPTIPQEPAQISAPLPPRDDRPESAQDPLPSTGPAPATPPLIDYDFNEVKSAVLRWLIPIILGLTGLSAVTGGIVWMLLAKAARNSPSAKPQSTEATRFSCGSTTSVTPSNPDLEETMWVGHASQWNYFWTWFWGILLLIVGIGFFIMLNIFVDRAGRVYIVTNRKVIFQFGLFAKSTNEVRIKDIRSINVTKRGIAGLMGVGSVEFSSAASDGAEIVFYNIPDADSVRDMVRYFQDA